MSKEEEYEVKIFFGVLQVKSSNPDGSFCGMIFVFYFATNKIVSGITIVGQQININQALFL